MHIFSLKPICKKHIASNIMDFRLIKCTCSIGIASSVSNKSVYTIIVSVQGLFPFNLRDPVGDQPQDLFSASEFLFSSSLPRWTCSHSWLKLNRKPSDCFTCAPPLLCYVDVAWWHTNHSILYSTCGSDVLFAVIAISKSQNKHAWWDQGGDITTL